MFNSTVALNLVDTEAVHVTTSGSGGGRGGTTGPSGGLGGGLNVSKGTVVLTSTIIALNTSGTDTKSTADDIAGAVAPSGSYNLIGAGGSGGLTGTNHNQVGVAKPGLGAGRQRRRPNQTIALQNGSPAIGAGSNPEKLVADERGYKVPAGSPWDIGAYQTLGVADSTPPTAAVEATSVTSSNAGALNPFQFTITYSSDVAILATSLAGAVVQVTPPSGAPISSTVVSTTPVGPTDASGNALEFVVTYEIAPPGGAWTLADNGTYTIELGGAPITDLAGKSVAGGAVGTFSVQIESNQLVVTAEPPGTVTAGASFSVTVSYENSQGVVQTGWTGSVSIALLNSRGATLHGNLTSTASAGVATFSSLTLDAAADGYAIQVTSTGVPDATSSSFDVTAATASQLLVTAGPPSSVTAGSKFGLSVTAEDQFGNIATAFGGSVDVALKNNPGGGSLGGTVSMTPTQGVATFSSLELDTAGVGYTIQVTSTGVAAAITNSIDVTPAATSQLVITAEPPSAVTAGVAFGLTVKAEDRYGNAAIGFGGSIAVALDSNPGGGTLGGTSSLIPTNGVATFSDLELDKAASGYTIQATSTGLTAATSGSFDVTPAAPSQLLVTSGPPSTITAGVLLGLSVTAEDTFGNVATGFAGSIAVALKNNPGAADLGGTPGLTPTNGVATFSDLQVDKAGSGYTIQVTSTGLASATTSSFDITPAAASQLVVTSEPPSSVTAGVSFGLTVTAEDQYGNEACAYAGSVCVATKSNPGGGSLMGTPGMTPTSGVATFSDLVLDTAASGYTIQATSSGLSSATTSAFDVTPAAASQLHITTQPPSSVSAGSLFGLTVSAEDRFGNVATGFAGSIAVALKSNPGGGSLVGTPSMMPTSGVAAFSGLAIDSIGNGYSIQATCTGLTSATTNSFDVTAAVATRLVVTRRASEQRHGRQRVRANSQGRRSVRKRRYWLWRDD